MYGVLEFIFSALDFVYLNMYLNIFLHKKRSNKTCTVIIGIIVFSMLSNYVTQFHLYKVSADMICFILMSAYAFIYFKEDIRTLLLASILFDGVLMGISLLVINLAAGVTMKSIDEIMAFHTVSRICIVTLVKILSLFIVRMLKNLKMYLNLEISHKYKYMLMGIVIFSMLCIAIVTKIALETKEVQVCRVASIMITCFIILNMAIVVLINQIGRYLEEQNTLKIIINSQEMLKKSIIEVDNKEKIIRKQKHDMLNHFSVLRYLIDNQDLTKATAYINDLQKEVEQPSAYFKTGNIIADAVINQKIEVGKADHIKFNIKVKVPEEIKITATDLGALLSNLLDNAIEAVREVDEEKRMIDINIHHKKLLVEVSNAVLSNPINHGELMRRKKENAKEHGYGMKSIQYVVNKYDGYLNYKCEENIFSVSILISIA